jgi:hypothetical protein
VARYQNSAKPRKVSIGDNEVIVDSALEEYVLRQLEEHGFHGLWIKPLVGLNIGSSNYTPDIELSVQIDGKSQRALVEIKPARDYFTKYIFRRMKGVANYYQTKILLLYADKQKSWYRIDYGTGKLTRCELPEAGLIPIEKLYKPLAMPARRIYSHHYKRPFFLTIAGMSLDFVAEIIRLVFAGPKRAKRKRKPNKLH